MNIADRLERFGKRHLGNEAQRKQIEALWGVKKSTKFPNPFPALFALLAIIVGVLVIAKSIALWIKLVQWMM